VFWLGCLAGWLAYHFIMNRTVMMRECCLKHFASHDKCKCRDCASERMTRA
jgi:hypothetical protein